ARPGAGLVAVLHERLEEDQRGEGVPEPHPAEGGVEVTLWEPDPVVRDVEARGERGAVTYSDPSRATDAVTAQEASDVVAAIERHGSRGVRAEGRVRVPPGVGPLRNDDIGTADTERLVEALQDPVDRRADLAAVLEVDVRVEVGDVSLLESRLHVVGEGLAGMRADLPEPG